MTAIKQIIARKGQPYITSGEIDSPPVGHVQVRTAFSGISAGTEQLTLDNSLNSDAEMTLGYQLVGEVIEAAPDMHEQFAAGTCVACYGGPYVHHASVVNVPKHLVVKLPDGTLETEAAYCGLGTIALHAFRRGQASLGETVGVIGLGMLGNLVAQMAVAAGCRTVAVDLVEARRKAATQCGIPVAASSAEFADKLRALSAGKGADAIFIVVANCRDQLLADAVDFVRERGRVVIVGTAEAVLPRNRMFQKEAEITVARAGGPGRYDRDYEYSGHDYPYAYARWTEGRNLEEFVRLLGEKKVCMSPLISSAMRLEGALEAYRLLREKPDEYVGIVVDWRE